MRWATGKFWGALLGEKGNLELGKGAGRRGTSVKA